MKNSSYYINEIKRVQNIESDYAVAKLLDISRQAMTKYKNGTLTFDSHIIFRVAELSGHNPLEILVNMKASKEKDPSYLKKWKDLIKMVPGTAAVVILSASVMLSPSDSEAGHHSKNLNTQTMTIMLSSIYLIYTVCLPLSTFNTISSKLAELFNRPYSRLSVF